MGGHGGLNILPQKRWNPYRKDNREKVKRDEEVAKASKAKLRAEKRRRMLEEKLDVLRKRLKE